MNQKTAKLLRRLANSRAPGNHNHYRAVKRGWNRIPRSERGAARIPIKLKMALESDV